MKDIVYKMLENWHILLILYFSAKFISIITNAVLKMWELKVMNKDTIKIGINSDSKVIEITSSNLKLKDIQKLNENNLLEYENKKVS